MTLGGFFLLLLFRDRVSLCSRGCSWTHGDCLVSASPVPNQMFAATPSWFSSLIFHLWYLCLLNHPHNFRPSMFCFHEQSYTESSWSWGFVNCCMLSWMSQMPPTFSWHFRASGRWLLCVRSFCPQGPCAFPWHRKGDLLPYSSELANLYMSQSDRWKMTSV